MRKSWASHIWTIGLILPLIAVVGCSDDSDPADPGGSQTDTTPPQVVGMDPSPGESDAGLTEEITVVFSEPMDPTTATGNVTLSSGTISSLDWTDSRTLVITHTAWVEGSEVTVTLGTGLTDVAGNGLSAAHTTSFWTETTTLTLLTTNPPPGANDVNRDANVMLLFSARMNLSSLATATSINDAVGKVAYDFTLDHGEDNWVIMSVNDRLPEDTQMTIMIDTTAQDEHGNTLDSTSTFGFRTGLDIDETPPTVVSIEPNSGQILDPGTGFLRITFSESINPDTFEPTSWNAELAYLFISTGAEPIWTENNTIITVSFPTPMPAGLPMTITFAGFEDMNGVMQDTPLTWEGTVAGTADYYPTANGTEMMFAGYWERGLIIGGGTRESGDSIDYLKVEAQSSDTFNLVEYMDSQFSEPEGDWEIFRRTGSALLWLGFQDGDPGDPVAENIFDSPVTFLPLPITTNNWTSSTTLTVPGEGTFTATLSGQVVGQEDLPLTTEKQGELFYKDTWKVIRVLDASLDGVRQFTSTETTWYSATLGPVKITTMEERHDEGEWEEQVMHRFFPEDF